MLVRLFGRLFLGTAAVLLLVFGIVFLLEGEAAVHIILGIVFLLGGVTVAGALYQLEKDSGG